MGGNNISTMNKKEINEIKSTKEALTEELHNLSDNILMTQNEFILQAKTDKIKINELEKKVTELSKYIKILEPKKQEQKKNLKNISDAEFSEESECEKSEKIIIEIKDIDKHIKNILCNEEDNTWIPDEIEEKICRKVFNYIINFE